MIGRNKRIVVTTTFHYPTVNALYLFQDTEGVKLVGSN
jgi:hypothetical protein